jgi:hypothetical protein
MRVKTFRVLLFAVAVMAVSCLSSVSSAHVAVSVSFGPPALPVYEQPICPGDGYLWTPGYWAWDGDDYYWVPGTWVLSPEVGFLWTPPWWGWENGFFLFHDGFWGPHIGFYGGIDYGFGYFGVGFLGGRWDGGHFFYNRSITNVNVVNIHNVYNETVVHENVTVNRVAYNGGPGGITARATAEEEAAARDRHVPPVSAQNRHLETARGNPELKASANHGKPPVAATGRPGEFSGHEVVAAREAGGEYHPPANRAGGAAHPESGARPVHPNDLPRTERPAPSNTGDAKLDRKYQQQQDKLYAKQQKDQQKLQKQQDREHEQMMKQNATDARRQQVEQTHQQQTEHMQQRQTQEQQHLQQRQQPQRK